MKRVNMINILRIGFFFFIAVPFVSAVPGLSIELKPNFFLDGKNIIVYNNETPFDGISFEVIGNNLNDASRIVNLTITKISLDIEEYFPNNTEILISGQRKILWTSEIIDTSIFNYSEPLSLIIGVTGKNEVPLKEFYKEDQIVVNLNNPLLQGSIQENVGFITRFGEIIWEGNPSAGIFSFIVIFLVLIYVYWYYKGPERMMHMREKAEYERIQRRNGRE